jgi:prepilin peptidase CpaA
MLNYLTLYLLPALLLLAAGYDVAAYRIPNWVCAAIAGAYLPVAILSGMPYGAIGLSALVGLGALIVGMGLFAFKWFGGGDAKMMAASALWLALDRTGSMMGVLAYLMVAGVIGGVFALALLMFRRAPLPAAFAGRAWLLRLHTQSEGIPYGVALAGAGIYMLPKTLLYAHLIG